MTEKLKISDWPEDLQCETVPIETVIAALAMAMAQGRKTVCFVANSKTTHEAGDKTVHLEVT